MSEGTVQFRRKKAFATLYREVAPGRAPEPGEPGPAGPHGLPAGELGVQRRRPGQEGRMRQGQAAPDPG